MRDCPSSLAPHWGLHRPEHAWAVAHHSGHQVGHADATPHEVSHAKVSRPPRPLEAGQTIYVAPKGRSGGNAGRSASHPLGNLALALRRARPGATIILAPGTYGQRIRLYAKSNITIVGAADQSSILAPSGGDALTLVASNNITVENVWLRAQGSGGRGLVVEGSSVNLMNVKTADTRGDGVVAVSSLGRDAIVNATSSQFDLSQTGYGMELGNGAIANLTACTFNHNGTAQGAVVGGGGLGVSKDARATITDSQFIGNLNSNLAAGDQSSVTARGSTFSNSIKGDGAIFLNQASVQLIGNTFASNGQVVDYASGFNGIEFFNNFTGNAVVSGNTFLSNTANGIFVGGSSQTLQITDNVFDNNLVGLNMDSSIAPINAIIQGNTFEVAPGSSSADQGLVAAGSGVTATIGGSDNQQNIFENYADQASIRQYHSSGSPPQEIGCPHVAILGNRFLQGGRSIDPSQAILPC